MLLVEVKASFDHPDVCGLYAKAVPAKAGRDDPEVLALGLGPSVVRGKGTLGWLLQSTEGGGVRWVDVYVTADRPRGLLPAEETGPRPRVTDRMTGRPHARGDRGGMVSADVLLREWGAAKTHVQWWGRS
jgi:hypothetical protein